VPIITRLILQRPDGGPYSHTMNIEAEFASNLDPTGAKLNLSATIPNNPKITIEDLQKKSYDLLFEILRERFDTAPHTKNGFDKNGLERNGVDLHA
jgi:hypothetical protein